MFNWPEYFTTTSWLHVDFSSFWESMCVSVRGVAVMLSDNELFLPVLPSFRQRLMQYLASRNTLFNLNNFLDKAALQGDLIGVVCL